MARTSKPVAGDLLTSILQLPVWVPLLGAAVLALLIGQGDPVIASVAVLPLLIAPYVWVRTSSNRARSLGRVAAGDVKQNLALLSWPAFLRLVSNLYQQRGYTPVETAKAVPEGGVEHAFRNSKGLYLVVCKHTPNKQLAASVVRDLYGVMSGVRAAGGAVINVGGFDADAVLTARKMGIDLLDADALAKLLRVKPPALLFTHRVDKAAAIALVAYMLVVVAAVNVSWAQWLGSLWPAPAVAQASNAPAAPASDPASDALNLARHEQEQRNYARAAADRARKQLDEDKVVAWNRAFIASKECIEPANWKTQVECGNEYMRARKQFDEEWEKAHPAQDGAAEVQ